MLKFIEKNEVDFEKKLIQLITSEDPDVIIIKDFELKQNCFDLINNLHDLAKELDHREEKNNWFFSYDVLPTRKNESKMNAKRIVRSWEILDLEKVQSNTVLKVFRKLRNLQINCIVKTDKLPPNNMIVPQIYHYPIGGGFFQWHSHPRFPTNYGLILNLAQKGEHFDTGATEIVSNDGEVIKIEEHCNAGDLALFKYDLKHRVAPCDPDKDLTFGANGRWTAIMPIQSRDQPYRHLW